jgi:hypothetical protein
MYLLTSHPDVEPPSGPRERDQSSDRIHAHHSQITQLVAGADDGCPATNDNNCDRM